MRQLTRSEEINSILSIIRLVILASVDDTEHTEEKALAMIVLNSIHVHIGKIVENVLTDVFSCSGTKRDLAWIYARFIIITQISTGYNYRDKLSKTIRHYKHVETIVVDPVCDELGDDCLKKYVCVFCVCPRYGHVKCEVREDGRHGVSVCINIDAHEKGGEWRVTL